MYSKMSKTHQFQENHSGKIAKKSQIDRFFTGIQVPDTFTDQDHLQLSRSYVIAYAESSSETDTIREKHTSTAALDWSPTFKHNH